MANKITSTSLGMKWRGKDQWLTDGGSRGAGRLVAKISQAGASFYFQYFDSAARRRFLPIGPHEASGKRGVTLQAARDRAAELSAMHRNGKHDLHEHFAIERAAEQLARKAAEAAAREAEQLAQRATLRQLLEAYTAHLVRLGKKSIGDVRSVFNRHLYEAAPDLAAKRAADIPAEDFVILIGRVAEAGKGRTAAKFRSYLRAAYALAIKSKTDPAAPMTLRTFGISMNPIAGIDALSQFNRERDRNLSAEELCAFMKRLDALPDGVQKDALWLYLLLAGQRPAQLVRVRPADVDLSAGTITLYDPKGGRKQPRPHVLPLTKRTTAILQRLLESYGEAPVLFSSDGKRAMSVVTLSHVVTTISAAMVKAKEARAFQLRDIRRTCETMLAGMGVSSDIRAQLLSHGLSGVQQKHYDRHGYALEKRDALAKWERHLDRIAAGKKTEVARPKFGKAKAG